MQRQIFMFLTAAHMLVVTLARKAIHSYDSIGVNFLKL